MPPPARVLDVGAGNGAIEFAISAHPGFETHSVEMLWNEDARHLHRRRPAPLRRSIAYASKLPFSDDVFDAVVLLETLEHIKRPFVVCEEIERVLKPGGIILITTPPRWRYLLRPDPHFGIRGLLLLPSAAQRAVADHRGFDRDDHYVDKIYWSVRQVQSLFPGCALRDVISRSRAPSRWFWDAIVLQALEE